MRRNEQVSRDHRVGRDGKRSLAVVKNRAFLHHQVKKNESKAIMMKEFV